MTTYVALTKFRGDWRNHGMGRTVKCPHCGYAFRSFIALSDARCPNGHRMAVLSNTARGAATGARNQAGKRAARNANSEREGAGRVAVGGDAARRPHPPFSGQSPRTGTPVADKEGSP